jgi:metal-responsive CopG/Arc/MetJ family transcriptional regulator
LGSLPKYLVDELDAFTHEYALNRSDLITESIKAFIAAQKERRFYENFEISCKELQNAKENGGKGVTSLRELLHELAD